MPRNAHAALNAAKVEPLSQLYSIHQDFVYIHWAQLQLTFEVFFPFFLVFYLLLGWSRGNLLDCSSFLYPGAKNPISSGGAGS